MKVGRTTRDKSIPGRTCLTKNQIIDLFSSANSSVCKIHNNTLIWELGSNFFLIFVPINFLVWFTEFFVVKFFLWFFKMVDLEDYVFLGGFLACQKCLKYKQNFNKEFYKNLNRFVNVIKKGNLKNKCSF